MAAAINYIGYIGVDAGLAGFFNNKEDYDDDAWQKLCDNLGTKDAMLLPNGAFTSSGFGDGSYAVFTNDEETAFVIDFGLYEEDE